MNQSTINIADFRCRTSHSRGASAPQSVARPHGFKVVASHGVQLESPSSWMRTLSLESAPAAFDIERGREAQRAHRRLEFRPIPLQPRAKVLRFGSSAPLQMPAQITVPARQASAQVRPVFALDPQDLPPAA